MDIHRIQNLLNYFENNYHRPISPAEIEEVSHYSYRNIQRIFLAITTETIGQYCTRLKLENAYKLLVYTDLSILDITLNVGYENTQSFTKAFKNKFNITPLTARQTKITAFDKFINNNHNIDTTIHFEYHYIPSVEVYARLLINNNYDNEVINAFWREIEHQNVDLSHYDSYGVIIDQPLLSDPQKCRYEACVSDVDNKKSFYKKQLFGQWYAKYIHIDSPKHIEDTYRLIYQQWLSTNCYNLDTTPIIEQYIADQSIADHWSTIIYVPIKRKLSI